MRFNLVFLIVTNTLVRINFRRNSTLSGKLEFFYFFFSIHILQFRLKFFFFWFPSIAEMDNLVWPIFIRWKISDRHSLIKRDVRRCLLQFSGWNSLKWKSIEFRKLETKWFFFMIINYGIWINWGALIWHGIHDVRVKFMAEQSENHSLCWMVWLKTQCQTYFGCVRPHERTRAATSRLARYFNSTERLSLCLFFSLSWASCNAQQCVSRTKQQTQREKRLTLR